MDGDAFSGGCLSTVRSQNRGSSWAVVLLDGGVNAAATDVDTASNVDVGLMEPSGGGTTGEDVTTTSVGVGGKTVVRTVVVRNTVVVAATTVLQDADGFEGNAPSPEPVHKKSSRR